RSPDNLPTDAGSIPAISTFSQAPLALVNTGQAGLFSCPESASAQELPNLDFNEPPTGTILRFGNDAQICVERHGGRAGPPNARTDREAMGPAVTVSRLADEHRTACAEMLGELLDAFVEVEVEHRWRLLPSAAMYPHKYSTEWRTETMLLRLAWALNSGLNKRVTRGLTFSSMRS
ncbi:MAG: hypothetical protein ACTIC1_07050, partial [Brevibacterium sp.]